MSSSAQCSILWSIFCFYIDSHFLFFLPSPISYSLHHLSAAALPYSPSLSLSLVIYILVTVVTWLEWLDPGLVALRGERFWLGIDRPWTYCMWPCRVKGSTYAYNTALMNTHTVTNTSASYSGKSLQTLKVVTGVFNLIKCNNSSTTRRQSELTAILKLSVRWTSMDEY